MSLSHIFVSSDSKAEIVGSPASHIILSNTTTMPAEAEVVVAASPAGVLDPALVVDSKSKPFEDPSSLVDTTVLDSDADPLGSPTTSNYFARSDTEYDPEEFTEEDPSRDDSSDENTSGVDEPTSFRLYPHLLPRHHLFSLLFLSSLDRRYSNISRT
ncbi:hypothetical protein Tco_0204634 [Tanacetum coccineum]